MGCHAYEVPMPAPFTRELKTPPIVNGVTFDFEPFECITQFIGKTFECHKVNLLSGVFLNEISRKAL